MMHKAVSFTDRCPLKKLILTPGEISSIQSIILMSRVSKHFKVQAVQSQEASSLLLGKLLEICQRPILLLKIGWLLYIVQNLLDN